MSGSRWFLLLVFAAFALTAVDLPFSWNNHQSADGIAWRPYDPAMAQAGTERKPVFLHFWAEWCQYCRKMARETFRDAELVRYLNDKFVSIRVNYDKQKPLVEQFGVNGLPTSFLIDTDGRRIGPLPGFIPPDRLLAALKKIQ
jgi:thioredoxin-related protein